MENIKQLNEKKMEYLGQYREAVRRIARIESELEEIREMKTSISINNDGMPHGYGKSDLSNYVADLDELERDLVKERYKRIKLYKEISQRIKKLRNKNENDVLFYLYIKGMDFYEIAEKMNYSDRWIRKLHWKGLTHIEVPEQEKKSSIKFLEVQ